MAHEACYDIPHDTCGYVMEHTHHNSLQAWEMGLLLVGEGLKGAKTIWASLEVV